MLGNVNFYKEFEDKFRGPQEKIVERQSAYLPYMKLMHEIDPTARFIDLGSGRGEWLDILKSNNLHGVGVDLNDGMINTCRVKKHTIIKQDVNEFLVSLPSESCSAITSFHLIEHLSFDKINVLIRECFRAIKPGGLLIIELPNIDNFRVASYDFWMDPEHIRAIPLRLLAYLCEYHGFYRIQTMGLQEKAEIMDSSATITLLDVLTGASPDCSVICQKKAEQPIIERFNGLFSMNYGIDTASLAIRYEARIKSLESWLHRNEEVLKNSNERIAEIEQSFIWRISTQLNRIFSRIFHYKDDSNGKV